MSDLRNPSSDDTFFWFDNPFPGRPPSVFLERGEPIDTAHLQLMYGKSLELSGVDGGYRRSAQIHPAHINRLGGSTMESYCYNDIEASKMMRVVVGPEPTDDLPCPIDFLDVRQFHATTWLSRPPLEFSTDYYVGDLVYRRDRLRTHLLRSAAMSLVLAVRGGRLKPRVPRSVMVRNRHDGLFLTQDGAGTTLLGTLAGVFYPWEAQDIYAQQPDRWVLIDRDSFLSLDISTRE